MFYFILPLDKPFFAHRCQHPEIARLFVEQRMLSRIVILSFTAPTMVQRTPKQIKSYTTSSYLHFGLLHPFTNHDPTGLPLAQEPQERLMLHTLGPA